MLMEHACCKMYAAAGVLILILLQASLEVGRLLEAALGECTVTKCPEGTILSPYTLHTLYDGPISRGLLVAFGV